ncbi:methyltransferase domain-containing protein [Phthorimaea operculella]|nr:methyltransferase domain-containing protein [Phthorimaea operculella]
MFKPELYGKNNSVPAKDSLECLNKFKSMWRKKCRVLDLGCGDGGITSRVLRPFLPPGFGLLVGADIGPEMVAFANATHGDQRCKFIELDMTGDVPDELVASFDHVFSSYAIHWVHEQEETFSNVHTLLAEGGSCLLLFVAYTRVYDFYRILAKHPKWQSWLKGVERYISPYQDMQDPDKEVHRIMANVGFKDIHIEYERKTCYYEEQHFRDTMLAIFPMKIPLDLVEEFMDDYMQAGRQMNIVADVGAKTLVCIDYTLITAVGTKL